MKRALQRKSVQNAIIGVASALFVAGKVVPNQQDGPVLTAAVATVADAGTIYLDSAVSGGAITTSTRRALTALSGSVRRLSHPAALEDAFRSYYAYKAENADKVRKPYLYFVDYGLSATTPRGYVFDMEKQTLVEGPFMVAAGRGSAANSAGIPTRFSNAPGSAATSLGLYLAQETYDFRGKASGMSYRSVGLRLKGLSADYNDNARMRGVVAHGAPYVTASKAGRSEGCPALEQARAERLLPMLANGGMVFLFAPDEQWMDSDPWVVAGSQDVETSAKSG